MTTAGPLQTDDEFVAWLLDSQIPSLRYLTLSQLCRLAPDDARLLARREAIMRRGPVPAILASQTAAGNWDGDRTYYTPKYVTTHWNLMLLVELQVDGVDYMLRNAKTASPGRLQRSLGLSCFWGNLLRYVLHAGRAADPRVQDVVDGALLDLQVHGRCTYNDGVACAWGVARTLWGLAALPRRSPTVEQAIEDGLAFLVDSHRLARVDYPLPPQGRVHSLWSRLNFPLFYQADVLFTLRVLAELGALQRTGAQPALDWLLERRQKNGRWRGSSPFRRRTWPEMGTTEETDRWVSLHSALVLQQAGRLSYERALRRA
jgi:hypothetical protein